MGGIAQCVLWIAVFALAHVEAVRSRTGVSTASQLRTEMATTLGKNPIRKVVTLMQDMQKEIELEGKKEKELFEKFMCFCSSSGGELTKAAEDAKSSIEELGSKLKSEEAEKSQTEQELKDHKSDREQAKKDLAEATSLRDKEAAEYDSASAEAKTNIASMESAIATLEKATSASAFLQLPIANKVKELADRASSVDDWDKKGLIAFIENKDSDQEPASAQIIGVMKQMLDEFTANSKQSDEDEASASASFEELKGSKEKEIEFATESIEKKTVRSGELAVSVVQTKDELEDTTAELEETEKYAAGLEEQCAAKEKENAARVKARTDEIAAVGEAISILNDDDALDVFKKAAPSSLIEKRESLGFLQQTNHKASRVHRAQALLAETASRHPSQQLRLILYTMNSKIKLQAKGKSTKFTEIIKMVDDMIVVMGKEQANDEKSKTWCEEEFEKAADDESKAKSEAQALDAGIEETTDSIAQMTDEIAALGKSIQELDYAVAQATEQRKEEHAEYVEALTLNEAAIGLIGKAKARLEKFYKPSAAALVQKPNDDDLALSFMQAKSDEDDDVAPPEAPPTASGEYKKNEKSGGVMGLMDMMIHEMEMDAKDAQYAEKTAQSDYGTLMSDSQATRAQDAKSITDKEAAKAQMEGQLQDLNEKKSASTEELMGIAQMIQNLHSSCDFIMKNFDMRKEARTNEIESLKNAKAILSGADFR